MSVSLTEEQKAAIAARGKIIVSASAGSGKTFVMIERIVSHILAGGNVNRILAVTFTKKAATQMRDRLRAALSQKTDVSKEERARLKEQLYALPSAEISTLHAFCARLVRSYFYLAGVDSAFRIIASDDAEGKRLSLLALDEVFDSCYEENEEWFQDLLKVYFRGKKDAQLRKIALSCYKAVRGLSDYKGYLEKAGNNDFHAVADYLYRDFLKKLDFIVDTATELQVFFVESCQNEKALKVCGDILNASMPVSGGTTLFEMATLAAVPFDIAKMPQTTKAKGEERRNLLKLKSLSAYCKEVIKDLSSYAGEEEEKRRFSDAEERARALMKLVLRYDEAFSRLKREANELDYEDLEHFALSLLQNEAVLASVREKYDEIFVDEYQDINPVQEKILSLLNSDELFLVGDAKQSIYGFRGSRSEYFINQTKALPSSLMLSENFRSAPAVIGAVNKVFLSCMRGGDGGVDYLFEGVMRGGARYGENKGEVIFHRIPKEKKEEKQARGVYSVLNVGKKKQDPLSEKVARIIQSEIGKEWFDADKQEIRRVDYGDIAVLLRNAKTDKAARLVATLSENDIPVTASAKTNACDYWEARLLIDWLSFLDNMEQDIPLAGAMLSSIGGFSESELARVRMRFSSPFTFRSACKEYREKMQDDLSRKLDGFFEKAENYRKMAQIKRAGEMMGVLLADGLEAEIAAKRDGRRRMERVHKLLAEGESYGVNAFLHRLKASSYQVDYSEIGGEGAVKVLTMHAAKGLEYPVVILADMDTPFHGAETDDVIYCEEFGFAPKSYAVEERTSKNTILRRAVAVQQRKDEVKGEMNLFYVAMTRAKYRLHMLFEEAETALAPQCAKKFSDFVDFASCEEYFKEEAEEEREPLERRALVYRPDEGEKQKVLSVYQKPYPYAESLSLPVKSSATGFMKLEETEENRAPIFVKDDNYPKTDIETGLAYHAFLQNVRFGENAKEELCRMEREKLLSKEQISRLSAENLDKILALPALKRLSGRRVYREQKFMFLLPAREVSALHTEADDEIVVQGAIDLLAEEEGGYAVVDYKYSARSDESLKESYATQIDIYKRAVARITRTPVEKVRAVILNIMRLREIEM